MNYDVLTLNQIKGIYNKVVKVFGCNVVSTLDCVCSFSLIDLHSSNADIHPYLMKLPKYKFIHQSTQIHSNSHDKNHQKHYKEYQFLQFLAFPCHPGAAVLHFVVDISNFWCKNDDGVAVILTDNAGKKMHRNTQNKY